jgi:hypothetical protein
MLIIGSLLHKALVGQNKRLSAMPIYFSTACARGRFLSEHPSLLPHFTTTNRHSYKKSSYASLPWRGFHFRQRFLERGVDLSHHVNVLDLGGGVFLEGLVGDQLVLQLL